MAGDQPDKQTPENPFNLKPQPQPQPNSGLGYVLGFVSPRGIAQLTL